MVTYARVHRRLRLPRVRIAGLLLAVALFVGAVGGLLACFVVPTAIHFGPNDADVVLTTTPTEVIDLGPLGTITKPGGVFGAGVRVTVKKIPEHPIGANDTMAVEDYVRLYSGVGGTAAEARAALLRHALWWGLGTDIVVFGAVMLGRAALGATRRRELLTIARRRVRRISVALATTIVAVSGLFGVHVASTGVARSTSSQVFENTPLQGATVDGAVLQLLVNKYGPRVVEFVDTTNRFYDTLGTRLTDAARHQILLRPTETTRTIVFTAGFHCNVGMARVTGRVVDLWKPTFVLSAGDDALGASGFEGACIGSLGQYLRGQTVLVAPGDHDSAAAIARMNASGFTVLDGHPRRVSGFRVLGDADPRIASLASGLTPRRSETVVQMGHRLADRACASRAGITIVLANEPGAVRESASRGCAQLVLAGSKTDGPIALPSEDGSTAVGYFAGSAGGAAPDMLTLGALHAAAHETIIQLDAANGTPLRYQSIEFAPDGTTHVAPPAFFPGTTPSIVAAGTAPWTR